MRPMNSPSRLTYVGHATVLLELDGCRIITDPLLRDRVAFLRRRWPLAQPERYRTVDAVLLSHLHRDHLDIASLRRLGADVRILAPLGAARPLARRGFHNVQELAPGDVAIVGRLAVQATYAAHDGRHGFGLAGECIGFVVMGPRRIYFAGDTDLFPEMANLAGGPSLGAIPRLDVALLPIWGWWHTLRADHMDPLRAAQALTLLRPRLAIPIHWGTLHPIGVGWFEPRFLTVPAATFEQLAGQLAPDVRVCILPPGDAVALDALFDAAEGL
jgi:L-ascorbate metabolism protein UlaG (beta-lactamase superfamily)